MRWPWQRRASSEGPQRPLVTPPRRDWAGLAPLQRTVGAPSLTAVGDTFAAGLASRSARSLVQPLTHGVLRDAPTGQLRGIARPSEGVIPEPAAAAPQPDLPLVGEAPPVQRTTRPVRQPLTSAPRIEAPGRRVRAVAPVQRQAVESAPTPDAGTAQPAATVVDGAVAETADADPHEAGGDGGGADLPLAADGGGQAVPLQRSASEVDTGPSAPPPARRLAEASGAQAVERDAPTLAAGQPLQHGPATPEGPADAGTPRRVGPPPAQVSEPDPLPVARSIDGGSPPASSTPGGGSPLARSTSGGGSPAAPAGGSRPSTAPPRAPDSTAVQRMGATGRRPPRRVGLGEPLVPPVQRSVAGGVAPSAPPGAPGPGAAGPSGGGPPVDAPLISGRASATSLGGPEPVPPVAEVVDGGDPADLPLQRSEAGSPAVPANPIAPDGGAAPGTGQAAASGPMQPQSSGPTTDALRPESAAPSALADSSEPAPAAAPLIGERSPATALGGAEPVPPPVMPASAGGATADRAVPDASADDLPLQRQAAGDAATTPRSSVARPLRGGMPLESPAWSTAAARGAAPAPADAAPSDSAAAADAATAPTADSGGGVSAADPDAATAAPVPEVDASPAGSSPMASVPLLPHRPALLQRTLDLHADSGPTAAGGAPQPAVQPMSPTASGPRGTASPAPAVSPAASRVTRPAQVVQPLRRVVDGTPAPASRGPSPAPVAPLDGVPPSAAHEAITDTVAGLEGPGAAPPSPGSAGALDVVPLQAAAVPGGAPGSRGIAQAVQTLTGPKPATPVPGTPRGIGQLAPVPGPVAVQRVAAAVPHGGGTAQPVPGSGTEVIGGDLQMALPSASTSLPATGLLPADPAATAAGLPLAEPTRSTAATAGPSPTGPTLTTAVQREITASMPTPERAVTTPAELQRQEAPPAAAAPAPAPAPAPPTATIAPEPANTSGGPGGPKSEEELDVLAGRLYDHIAGRLRHELRMDRERTGLLNDLH